MAARLTFPPGAMRHGEAAEYIGVSPRTLDALQARLVIIPIEIEGMKRWRREDLDEYLRTRPDWEAKAALGRAS